MRRTLLISAVVALAAVQPAVAGTVQLLAGSHLSSEVNGVSRSDPVTALPYAASGGVLVTAGQAVGVYSLTSDRFEVALQQSAGALAQYAGPGDPGFAAQSIGQVLFSVQDDRPYQLRAQFGQEGGLTWTGRVSLVDVAAGVDLVQVWASESATGEPGQLGQASGILSTGRVYSLRYDVQSATTTTLGRTAAAGAAPYRFDTLRATVHLDLQAAVAPVPLPAAAVAGLALMGAAAVAGRLGRRRAAP